MASTAGTPYGDYQTEALGQSTDELDAPRERNKWKIATIALAALAALAVVGVGMFLLGQSTRMSHSEVVGREHKLTTAAVLARASQDAAAEKRAVALAVGKQKTHDRLVAKKEAAHAKSQGETHGRAQGESTGKLAGEASGRSQGETTGKLQVESETTRLLGHDAEGYMYGTLPNGLECSDNPQVPAPVC